MAKNRFSRSEIVFSATRIEVLQSCLRKYFYEYVKPKRTEDVIYTDLALGLYFHKMAELFWRNSEPGNLKPFYKKKRIIC